MNAVDFDADLRHRAVKCAIGVEKDIMDAFARASSFAVTHKISKIAVERRWLDFIAGVCVVAASRVIGTSDEAFEGAFINLVQIKFKLLREAEDKARGARP